MSRLHRKRNTDLTHTGTSLLVVYPNNGNTLVSHHPVDQLLTVPIISWATCSALFQPPSRECATLGQLQLSVERTNLSSPTRCWVLRRECGNVLQYQHNRCIQQARKRAPNLYVYSMCMTRGPQNLPFVSGICGRPANSIPGTIQYSLRVGDSKTAEIFISGRGKYVVASAYTKLRQPG